MYKHRKLWLSLGSIFCLFFMIAVFIEMYVNTYYHATESAKEALVSTDSVEVVKGKNAYVFKPKTYDTGIIFYPGAK